MEKLNEILIEKLSLARVDERLDFLVGKINERIKPPKTATRGNVNIRVMYIVNDRINSHGGRFSPEDLSLIRRLIVDTPVLIGHNRQGEPLARNFHAELEQIDDVLWLKSFFYWPRSSDVREDELLNKIDSGVLKECSISFTYTIPECSRCGQDIRSCPHELEAGGPGADHSKTHFIYRGINQILETSLVYKGSVKGTYLSDKLSDDSPRKIEFSIDGVDFDHVLPSGIIISDSAAIFELKQKSEKIPEIKSVPEDLAVAIAIRAEKPYLLVKHAG